MDCIWQPAMTNQLNGWTEKKLKALHKAKLAPKKVMVTVWWSAAHLIHYRFLNPGKPNKSKKYDQQISEMHPKLQCLQLALVNKGDPILNNNTRLHVTQATLQKLNKLWTSFASFAMFTWPLTNWLTLLQASLYRKHTSITSRRQKMLSKSLLYPEARIFML